MQKMDLTPKALTEHLKLCKKKLKDGKSVDEVFNKADLLWLNMSFDERDKWRDKLSPRPTPEYTRELRRLYNKYK